VFSSPSSFSFFFTTKTLLVREGGGGALLAATANRVPKFDAQFLLEAKS